jgi:hypothetical protein
MFQKPNQGFQQIFEPKVERNPENFVQKTHSILLCATANCLKTNLSAKANT